MSEAEVINYMRQACEGLKHMHENSIVHLDIKVCSTDRLVISLFEDGRLPWTFVPEETRGVCYRYFRVENVAVKEKCYCYLRLKNATVNSDGKNYIVTLEWKMLLLPQNSKMLYCYLRMEKNAIVTSEWKMLLLPLNCKTLLLP